MNVLIHIITQHFLFQYDNQNLNKNNLLSQSPKILLCPFWPQAVRHNVIQQAAIPNLCLCQFGNSFSGLLPDIYYLCLILVCMQYNLQQIILRTSFPMLWNCFIIRINSSLQTDQKGTKKTVCRVILRSITFQFCFLVIDLIKCFEQFFQLCFP